MTSTYRRSASKLGCDDLCPCGSERNHNHCIAAQNTMPH